MLPEASRRSSVHHADQGEPKRAAGRFKDDAMMSRAVRGRKQPCRDLYVRPRE